MRYLEGTRGRKIALIPVNFTVEEKFFLQHDAGVYVTRSELNRRSLKETRQRKRVQVQVIASTEGPTFQVWSGIIKELYRLDQLRFLNRHGKFGLKLVPKVYQGGLQ
jgi:hypothetical protein